MCQRNTSRLGFQRVVFTKVKSPWKFFFMTRKSGFLFAFLSFICNFADDNQI